VEFTESEIIFYDRKKQRNFRLKYENIDYVEPFFQLVCWELEFMCKSDLLLGMEKDKIEDITHWFPTSGGLPGFPTSLIQFGIRTFTKDKERIVRLLRDHNVRILNPNDANDATYAVNASKAYYQKNQGELRSASTVIGIFIIILTFVSLFPIGVLATQSLPGNMRYIIVLSVIFCLVMDLILVYSYYYLSKMKKG
jgi:hypothetical protein